MIFDLLNYELLRTHPLCKYDRVRFIVDDTLLEYIVEDTYLRNASVGWNDKIFDLLNIKYSKTFCEEYYGYNSGHGLWPCYKRGDYEAATKVVVALFDMIAGVPDNSIKKITLSSWNGTIETLQ